MIRKLATLAATAAAAFVLFSAPAAWADATPTPTPSVVIVDRCGIGGPETACPSPAPSCKLPEGCSPTSRPRPIAVPSSRPRPSSAPAAVHRHHAQPVQQLAHTGAGPAVAWFLAGLGLVVAGGLLRRA